MPNVGPLLPIVLLGLAFYMLIIRPQRNRQRAQQRLVDQLAVGAKVMTTSGLFAEVAAIADDGVLLEVAPGVTMRWTRAAIARIIPEPEPEPDVEDDNADGETGAGDSALLEGTSEEPVSSSTSETGTDDTAHAVDGASDAESTERPT